MRPLLLLPFLGFLIALEPDHLKPGALTTHLGTVTLVEDVLLVRYPYTFLHAIPDTLEVISKGLTTALSRIKLTTEREVQNPSHLHSHRILSILQARLTFLHETLDFAKHDYTLHPAHARVKRGLLNALGKASQFIFGTAMDEDVQDLRTRYNQLTSIAATNRKVLTLNCKKIALLEQHVKELLHHTNNFTQILNSAVMRLDILNDFILLDQSLLVLETSLRSVVATNEGIIRNMVDAAYGRVTTSLFPVKDLLQTLDVGVSTYNLKPLFSSESVQYYYPVLETVLTSDAIVIHVPFQSADTFEAYEIEPFPFSVNSSVMTLDLPSSLVLVAKDYSFYAIGRLEDLAECSSSFLNLYHCSASLFAFLPISGGICEVMLTRPNASEALALCPYKHLVPKPVFHRAFHGYHYFFFVDKFYVSVICPNSTTYQQVSGHYAVLNACYLRSANLTTFPTRLHEAFTANFTTRIFPVTTLENISFSDISFVTNTLSTLTFSNHSEFVGVLEDSLPEYLSPIVLYSSFTVPVLIMVSVLLVLFCCVRKSLRLYNQLRLVRKAQDSASHPRIFNTAL